MSLEDSMKDLAESNRDLAGALKEYAAVVKKYGLKIESDNGGKSAPEEKSPTPAKGKPGPKPKAAKEEGDDDGFSDSKPKPKQKKAVTHDDVKAALLKVKEIAEDKGPALEIIGEFGYDGIPKIQEKDYEAIFEKANEWIEENS